MAIPYDAVWQVQTSGADTSGGGFSASTAGGTGTDHSQIAATSFTVTTTGTTTVTATSGSFDNTMLGNAINIAGDGVYFITGYTNSTTVTVDRATGTGTGISAKVGGPFATPGYAALQATGASNVIWLAGGTYTCTTDTQNVSGGKPNLTNGVGMIGYNATRGDNPAYGSRPAIVGTGVNFGNSLVNLGTGSAIRYISAQPQNTYELGVNGTGSAYDCDCHSSSAAYGFGCYTAVRCLANIFQVQNCCIECIAIPQNSGEFGFQVVGQVSYIDCISIGNGSNTIGWSLGAYSDCATLIGCIADNHGTGFLATSNNTPGDYPTSSLYFQGCISSRNVTKGWDIGSAPVGGIISDNCYTYDDAANTLGAFLPGTEPTTLASSPFASIGSNYTLTTASALRGSTQYTFPTLSGTSYRDPSAIQHQDAGGGLLQGAGFSGGMNG